MSLAYDVVIAGAGPAGAMTAHLTCVARPELRVLLIDALEAPAPRACGEFLAPDGVAVLERAGLALSVAATGAFPIEGLDFAGSGGSLRLSFATHRQGLGVRRERFDRALQDAASRTVELWRDARLLAAERCGVGWWLRIRRAAGEVEVAASLLIGADGRHSLVRHAAGLDRAVGRKRFALVCRASGIAAGARGEMHLSPLGQVGIAPLGRDEVNVNLLLAPASRRLLAEMEPRRLVHAALAATPTLRRRCRSVSVGPVLATGSLPHASSCVTGDAVALIGDAAGFCDPVTGEGMNFALRGAELAAEAIVALDFDRPVRFVDLDRYRHGWNRTIAPRMWLGERLQSILARRALSEALVRLLGRSGIGSRAMRWSSTDVLPT